MKRTLGVNEAGLRVGESHHNAKLTDAEVEALVGLRENDGLSYNRLAAMFEVGKSTVRDYCVGRRRMQRPARWKTVECA